MILSNATYQHVKPTKLQWLFIQVEIILLELLESFIDTVMILRFRTDRSGETVQTQIRLILEEHPDQGLHCLQCRLHPLGAVLYDKATLLKF